MRVIPFPEQFVLRRSLRIMDKKNEEQPPKKKPSLRIKLQKQNLKDERVLRPREMKSPQRLSEQQRKNISDRMKGYWEEKKETKSLVKKVHKAVHESVQLLLQPSTSQTQPTSKQSKKTETDRKPTGRPRGRPRKNAQAPNAPRRPKTNKKPKKATKPQNTKKTQGKKKAQGMAFPKVVSTRSSERITRQAAKGGIISKT